MLAGLQKRWVTSGLIAVGLLSAAAVYRYLGGEWNTVSPLERPLEILRDGVFYISPDNYVDTVKQLSRQGAVFLPAPQPDLQLVSSKSESKDYLGPDSCRECHASYVDSAAMTAHFRTCRPAHSTSIHGLFGVGKNVLPTGNSEMSFRMSQVEDRFYQSLVIKRHGENYVHSKPLELVTGSAKYGQSYLYWQNQCLYELPVSYFTDLGEWVNSPGYVDGVANFARPISARCLECHTTWFEQTGSPFNRFTSEGAIVGVTCEKCHGPGRQHVEHHHREPDDRQAKHIVNPADLPRDYSIDLCSLCHSGGGESLRESFSFRPGDRLADFVRIPPNTESGPGGVHSANQHARMALSRCFQESSEMQCTTCHNPHQQERGNVKLFVERCLKCHEAKDCGVVVRTGVVAEDRCIDCHMPRRSDSQMPMQKQDKTFRPMLRDHFIGKWDDVTADVLKELAPDLNPQQKHQ